MMFKLLTWLYPRPIVTVERALKKRNWRYLRLSDLIVTGVRTQAGNYIIIVADDHRRKTVLMMFLPLSGVGDNLEAFAERSRPPGLRVHQDVGHLPDQVANVCELLLEENYRILLGRFERNPSDGEIRFVVAIPYRDRPLSKDQVDWCIEVGISTCDEVFPKIYRLAS